MSKTKFTFLGIFFAFTDSVLATQKCATEAEVRSFISSHLKYAPDRRGGGGRRNTV